MSLSVVILAAGQGKRMQSQIPKVMHPVGGISLLQRIINTACQLSPQEIVVVYHPSASAIKTQIYSSSPLLWVEQSERLGTGHALTQALPFLNQEKVLVLNGDVPLISAETLKKFIASVAPEKSGILTLCMDSPFGYGRIIRDSDGNMLSIVEEKDATLDEKKIKEINSGIYILPVEKIKKWLPEIKPNNAQGEYYLTDIFSFAAKTKDLEGYEIKEAHEVLGVNDKIQLAQVERIYQRLEANAFMLKGVHIIDPSRVDFRGHNQIAQDTSIDINVILENVKIGKRCEIGANTILKDCILHDDVIIKSHSVIEGAELFPFSSAGPFARLRPSTVLKEGARVGNFVEIKKTIIGQNSKVNHLSYIGDARIGVDVNVGAGTITCNYDGVNKHETTIADHAFIGSGTQLVAPVVIGEGATIGAGSTITTDAPAHQLTLNRTEQRSNARWKRPAKRNKENH